MSINLSEYFFTTTLSGRGANLPSTRTHKDTARTKPDQAASRSRDKLAKGQSVHEAKKCAQKIISRLTCRSSSSPDLSDKPLGRIHLQRRGMKSNHAPKVA